MDKLSKSTLAITALLLLSAVAVTNPKPVLNQNVKVQHQEIQVEQGNKAKKDDKVKQLGLEPTGPVNAAITALGYAEKQGSDSLYLRFFWVSSPARVRDDFLIAFAFHLHLLSTQGFFTLPRLISHDLLVIDVRDYGWDARLEVLEKAAAVDFVFHQKAILKEDYLQIEYWPGGKDGNKEYPRKEYKIKRKSGDKIDIAAIWLPQKVIDELRKLTYSEVPILMAEWFFIQSARQVSLRNKQEGLGYYDFLGLKDRDAFFALTGTDEKVAERLYRTWRALVVRSGISQQSRQVVAYGAVANRVWGTLDSFTQQGQGVAQRNLRNGEFKHDVEEWYGFLPNGLMVTFLSDNKGVAAESAPDKIGPDDSPLNRSRDHRVHANLSCIRCHSGDKEMLKPVDDWVRKTFRKGGVLQLADPDKKVLLELQSEYLRDINELLDDDRRLYTRAIRTATISKTNPQGLSSAQIGKLYAITWDRYIEDDLTVEDAARELGVEPKKLIDGIHKHISKENRGATDLVLASFLDNPPQKLRRLDWEDSYALAMTLSLGINPPEIEKEVPKQLNKKENNK